MPTGEGSLGQLAVAGAQSAAFSLLENTERGARLTHWVLYAELSLTNPQEVEIFKQIQETLKPFCAPAVGLNLPAAITDCWQLLEYKDVNGAVCKFSEPLDLREILKRYARADVVGGAVHPDCTLTASILADLSASSIVAVDNTQSIARILFVYMGAVALKMSFMKAVVERRANELQGALCRFYIKSLNEKLESVFCKSNSRFGTEEIKAKFADILRELEAEFGELGELVFQTEAHKLLSEARFSHIRAHLLPNSTVSVVPHSLFLPSAAADSGATPSMVHH